MTPEIYDVLILFIKPHIYKKASACSSEKYPSLSFFTLIVMHPRMMLNVKQMI